MNRLIKVVSSLLYLFVNVILFVVVFVLACYVSFTYFVKSGNVSVPDLRGLDLDKASAIAQDSGLSLNYNPELDNYSREIEKDRVLVQDPLPGTLTKKGNSIEVGLSLGDHEIKVPSLRGKSLNAALGILRNNGISDDQIEVFKIYDDNISMNQVVATKPAPGETLKVGSKIAVFVSLGSPGPWLVMPELIGKSIDDVEKMLRLLNLSVGKITTVTYPGVDIGTVVGQFPLPGYPVYKDTVISIIVSEGEE